MEESKSSEVIPKEPQLQITSKNKKLTKSTIISIIILGFILIAGVATAAYTQIVLNNPDRIWSDALENTKAGAEELSTLLNESPVSGGTLSGSLSLDSPIAANLTLEGEWFKNEAVIKGETKIAGVTLNSDLRAVNDGDSETSDLYLKIDGLDGLSVFSELLAQGSRPLLEQANNTWYKLQSNDLDENTKLPTGLDLENLSKNEYGEEVEKLNSLLENYIYTSDETQNVINYDPIGREDFNGNDTYKYKITINEARSQELLDEINNLLSDTRITTLENTEETMESLNLDSILEESPTNLDVDVWVDMSLRYFRNARIYINQNEQQSYIDVGLDYDGGDEMPFYINVVAQLEDDSNMNLLLSATFNKASKIIDLQFNLTAETDQQPIEARGNISFIPGESSIKVEVPENYESFDSLIENIGLLSIFNSNTSQDVFEDSSFILDDVEL